MGAIPTAAAMPLAGLWRRGHNRGQDAGQDGNVAAASPLESGH